MLFSLRSIALVGALFACGASAIPKVTRTGRYLYQEDGTRFYVKGIGYQVQGTLVESHDNPFGEPVDFKDPLADSAACARDAPVLQEAGVNTIRVYSIDPKLNHDDCMKSFSDAGIYTILDLSHPPNGSIPRDTPSWSTNLLNLYITTIDAFKGYDNVIAYNIGNEVVTVNHTFNAPYLKAAARDTKAYLKSIGSEALVGYAAINTRAALRIGLAEYFSCGSEDIAIDFYGLNEYTWCGDASFDRSGYPSLMQEFANYNVVAYFSEYGCVRRVGSDARVDRLWTEVDVLFSEQMSDVWSGGIAFSYFSTLSQGQDFGLITLDGNTVKPSEEFTRLSNHYNAITPPNTPTRSAAQASTYGSCSSSAQALSVSTNLPPTPNEAACNCLAESLSCQFTPKRPDYDTLLGELIGGACGLLDGVGQDCNIIGSNGTTGVYGLLDGCDPTIKLSYVMSNYYESQDRNAEACAFSGNGTVNAKASNTVAAAAHASSCVTEPSAVFTPKSPGSGNNSSGGNGTAGGNTSDDDAAVSLNALKGVGVMAVIGVLTTVLTLF